MLQLAHGLLGLPHALGGGVHLAAQEVGILAVDGHLGQRLDLALDAIELDGDELGVLLRARRSCRGAVPRIARLSWSERADPLVAAGLRRRQALAQLLGLGARSPSRSSSAGTARGRFSTGAAGGTATAGGRVRACGCPPGCRTDPRPRRGRRPRSSRISTHRACSRSKRVRSASGSPLSMLTSDDRGDGLSRRRPARPCARRDLGVDRGAEPGHRHQPGQVRHLGGADERQQQVGERRQRRGGRAAEKEQEVPAEEERLQEVFLHPAVAGG